MFFFPPLRRPRVFSCLITRCTGRVIRPQRHRQYVPTDTVDRTAISCFPPRPRSTVVRTYARRLPCGTGRDAKRDRKVCATDRGRTSRRADPTFVSDDFKRRSIRKHRPTSWQNGLCRAVRRDNVWVSRDSAEE